MHKPNHFERAYIGRFWYFDVSKVSGLWSLAFWNISIIEQWLHHTKPGLNTSIHPESHRNPINIFFLGINICIDICPQTPPPGIWRQFRTTTDTNRHQMTPTGGPRLPKRLFKDVWRLGLTSNGICWCLLLSDGVC